MSTVEERASALPDATTFVSEERLSKFIVKCGTAILLEEDDESLVALKQAVIEGKTSLRKFISDSAQRVVILKKTEGEDEGSSTFAVDNQMKYYSSKETTSSIAFIKRTEYLLEDRSIPSQVHVLNLTEEAPLETLHHYLRDAVTPFFNSYVEITGRAERDGEKLVPSVQKKLNELEVGLRHLQQNIDIPEIQLQVNPEVQSVVVLAAKSGKKPSPSDFGDRVTNSNFLNALQKDVNKWKFDIQKVTTMDRDPSSGNALQEISFWLNLEYVLSSIERKRESPEVVLTMEILKAGKRFQAVVGFDSDTRLKEVIKTVKDYCTLMKDFPLNSLQAANSLDAIKTALIAIYQHMRKIRNTSYPPSRAIHLLEAISRDLLTQTIKVLATQKLLLVTYKEFEQVIHRTAEVFSCWDEEYDKLSGQLREIAKRKREDMMIKISYRIGAQRKLQARLNQLLDFRRQHEQLYSVIGKVIVVNDASLSAGVDSAAVIDENYLQREIVQAYENVKVIDCLDLSPEGSAIWDAALKRYDERIDGVETRIASHLRDQLGTAKNANEMFRIFSRYNALFVRPHIQGAIREYQTQLIQRVKDDIDALHQKFKKQYTKTSAFRMSTVRDIPPVSGSIIWAKQIDRQLTTYLQRVEAVLGKGWENHVEGQKLKADGDAFRQKLNTQQLFEEWKKKVESQASTVQGRIFNIVTKKARTGEVRNLEVNFQSDVIQLSKEVRNLRWMGFRVPLMLVNKANQANQLYPHAVALRDSVRTYELTCDKIVANQCIAPLVSSAKRDCQSALQEGVQLDWTSFRLENFVQKFAEVVFNFQERVDDAILYNEEIEKHLTQIATCEYTVETFVNTLNNIQKSVDELNLHSYSNLNHWVQQLDDRVEKELIKRLKNAVAAWTSSLVSYDRDAISAPMDSSVVVVKPKLEVIRLDMRITNQVIYLNPPVEMARSKLIDQLHLWLSVVTNLPRIQSARYQVELAGSEQATYSAILGKLMQETTEPLMGAFTVIDKVISDVSKYVAVWLQYQSLWDMEQGTITAHLGEDLGKWQQLLHEIKKSRTTFDNTEVSKEFGPVIIHYQSVQKKVNDKYDMWHKDVLTKFGGMLGQDIHNFFSAVTKARTDLETHSVDAASTSEAVAFITLLQELKRNLRSWEQKVELFKGGQKILDRQRFQYPSNWLYADHIESEWSAFNDILKRKDAAMQSQIAHLQVKIMAEDKAVEQRTQESLTEWEKGKPIQGDIRPGDATTKLQIFEGKFQRLKEDRENVTKARESLELDRGVSSVAHERLLAAIEEMQDLQGVWAELSKIWIKIDELKERPWLTAAPRKIRQELEALLEQLKSLPNNLKTYASFDYVQKMLRSYLKVNILITELKSEALKDRHWKQLMKKLRVHWVMAELTLGHIWGVDLVKNEAIIKDVILVAQGEMGLEVFLRQVREYWQSFELEMVNFQNKCRLIKSWDELFTKCKEHINQLSAMKLSPYFKVFEEESLAWEDKLNRVNSLFDVWIDVQRRWVYLQGIFHGSTDIRHLLPVETQKFQSISTEFLALMKKVAKSPQVLEILNIPQVQKLLERLSDLLTKIQKALGEYLEKERSSFPRFYFVGDEDLMEIIGNSKNVGRLQKHFKKMFAGVTSVILNEEHTEVLGVSSKEGEQVVFKVPVKIVDRRINEWLTSVEQQIRVTLAASLAKSLEEGKVFNVEKINATEYLKWLDKFQVQIITLTVQITWTTNVELALTEAKGQSTEPLQRVLRIIDGTLNALADSVLQEQPFVRRKKLEHLITELVHQRDMTRFLVNSGVTEAKRFEWLSQMRFYFDPKATDVRKQLNISIANANFFYGFEYLGVQEKLVQTPLTDRVYLTMTQALQERLGGSPFGPAGTGKTESVKALGNQLGRFVLVFNCDERFDFQAVGRIFVGLCQVGAWGCFDEFNRLEERMLSAVSQQIQAIQEALKTLGHGSTESSKPVAVELVGRNVKVSPDTGIFITMNPGYAGRRNLPDNLKQLFRSLAMTKPDRLLIAEVMLYSQGFRMAEKLASKVVPFFNLCDEQLSNQSHYDFGLRALKSVLVSAGNIKRERIIRIKEIKKEKGEDINESEIAEQLPEQEILIQSICETMAPKLVAEDIPLLFSLLSDVFPGIQLSKNKMEKLRAEIAKVCKDLHLVYGDNDETGSQWVEKVLQLYQISKLNHGLMMVGPSGSGKSTAWNVLLKALESLEGIEGVAHVIDPKAITKEHLYGVLDPNTREWTDGLFTHILRKIIDNVRGEINKRQWIIFDGDVDPEWVENLNSVLDDNKLLTLPNGERLGLPPNVRIMFEVQDLKYATLATVSRCGMIWFSEEVLSLDMIFYNFLTSLKSTAIDEAEEHGIFSTAVGGSQPKSDTISPEMQIQRDCADIIAPSFSSGGLIAKTLEYTESLDHIMEFTKLRALNSLFSMIHQVVREIIAYNQNHPDFPMEADQKERFVTRSLIVSILWAFSGDSKLKSREELGNFIRSVSTIPLPATSGQPIIDFEVSSLGEWVPWQNRVPKIEVETHKVGSPDIVVPTLDTVRHEQLLNTWLAEHKPMVLCGPPGSGKTMTLLSALRSLPDFEVVGLNFSSATTPELVMRTFEQYCEFRKTPNGIIMSPIQLGKWLVLFCDEINLPDYDEYGTQRVISFMRQIVEHGGFYRTNDQMWIKLERIQFVGACNPPTDPGRKPLSPRFLRHVPVVYVDYPGQQSLLQIYGTFNRAMLRLVPSLRTYADPLTQAMTEFYLISQERFTQDMQPHYIYSPRELTRWVKGICEALKPLETLSIDGLVRIWAHEALRLFQDRLVYDEERVWTEENIDAIALKYFPSIDRQASLSRPILFSDWITKDYLPVDREELREYVQARLKVFYEEELDVPLVLFDEVLEHVLRIDRIFKQHQGHLLLIGVSGSGKTTLSRFVAWINGYSVIQVKVHNKYTATDFDEDLRTVLRRAGCKDEKIVFIMDESNIMDSSFLERINTLLANGEVPGLFEGDDHTTLMTQCKEGSQREGLMLDSAEELYKWFTQQVMKNLHVVFTMNPSTEGLKDRASTSPALFNRCVLNWFGDWSTNAFYQVGMEFTRRLDIDRSDYIPPDFFPMVYSELPKPPSHRQAVVNAFVFVHQTLHQANSRLVKRGGNAITVSPRHFLDFIQQYVILYNEKRSDLEEQQLHLNVGLQKIKETVEQVEELQQSLSVKKIELEKKNTLANQKLKQMVHDQQEAEKKKKTSQEIQEELQIKTKEIASKKEIVLSDLAKVEPAVQDARQAVNSIKKPHLVEIRNLPNPPKMVKLALEAICLLLGEPTTDWKTIRSFIMRDNFISSIVSFSTEDISPEHRERMKREYLSDPQFNFETVNHASRACGPLVKWAIAQVSYADMLRRVEPLRNDLKALESEANETRMKGEEVEKLIQNLEKSIAQYKEEYAKLISEANTIKTDLEKVETKVTRSKALLSSLEEEKDRWQAGSEVFKSQMSTIVGDVLLTSAFLAYAGYFDQQLRESLYSSWIEHMKHANIPFRPNLSRVEYLSNADERLEWQKNSLPTDDLCVENAIMLKRFNRFPLIIDPSGQATEFLLNAYKDKKIAKTSFLDDAFRKNLESALRFGTPLLVQDVESYDPILNPVLNKEVRRTGGRVLITLGDQDIDLSPSFNIFLSTRDPTASFPPDLCSRVTFVNFTVTRSSLQSQCLHQVLKSERPDVDEKRTDLMKLQGEYLLRLRHLEKSLLTALNEAKGKILDSDDIITQLENLKKEANEVSKKMEETDVIMAEVERVSQEYLPLATCCSSIYFTLEGLSQIHFLYQFSLKTFMEVFQYVLTGNPKLKGVVDYKKRLSIITNGLFQTTYNRVARGMIHDDRIVFAVLLTRIYLKMNPREKDFNEEFDYLLRGKNSIRMDSRYPKYDGLSQEQVAAMLHLGKNIKIFADLPHYVSGNSEFYQWLNEVSPEMNVPVCWKCESVSQVEKALYSLLVIQTFRPDRVVAMTAQFVAVAMTEQFLQQCEQELDFGYIVEKEVTCSVPVLLASVVGFDASTRVDDLAAQMNKSCISVAMGSAEGFAQAEKAISSASKTGRWVMLKNVHLAPQWLVQMEKRLHSITPHSNFRLFLTMEINPSVPVNLLRASYILTFEPPPGVKANLLRTFNNVSASRMAKEPVERAKLYFIIAWFHAVVQERLHYSPLGWTKKYEFNESDLKMACDTVDTWLDMIAQGRSNVSPDKIPWNAFQTLLSQCIYGGRIDNDFDQKLINSFVNKLFTVKSFDENFALMDGVEGLPKNRISMPEGIKREDFINWIDQLPEIQTPSWLGLPNTAQKVMLIARGGDVVSKLLRMQQLSDDDDFASSDSTETGRKERDSRPAWIITLLTTTQEWLSILPKELPTLKKTADAIKDPLFRFYEREVNTGVKLLKIVRRDLVDVVSVCEIKIKQTNYLRTLISDLVKGIIPNVWKRYYTVPPGLTVLQWVTDFGQRIEQMQKVSTAASKDTKALKDIHVWLGGLFSPEAYVTASRQYVAQQNHWSLEELHLEIIVNPNLPLDGNSFGLTGLNAIGANVEGNKVTITSEVLRKLPLTSLHWVKSSECKTPKSGFIDIPVYLTQTRSEILFTTKLKGQGDFYGRGVALVCSGL